MKVKVFFGNDPKPHYHIWRRNNDSYAELQKWVQSSFPNLSDDFLLTYEDDEGDQVTIDDDQGLAEALELGESLEKKSVKIKICKRTEEPGAETVEPLDSALMKGEEIVSEPGFGLSAPKLYPEKSDAVSPLAVDILSTPRQGTVKSKISSDQVEGSQSLRYWVFHLLPLLAKPGVADELKQALPELFRSIESGDDFGTAMQTMIARCELIMEQPIVQEFMNHVQHKIAPLSDELVPSLLNLGNSGLQNIVNGLSAVAMNWQRGMPNLKFDVTPFLRQLCPNMINRLEKSNQLPREMDLAQLRLPNFQKELTSASSVEPTTSSSSTTTAFSSSSSTPLNDREAGANRFSSHRLMEVREPREDTRRSERPDWRRHSRRSRGRHRDRDHPFRGGRHRGRGYGDWYGSSSHYAGQFNHSYSSPIKRRTAQEDLCGVENRHHSMPSNQNPSSFFGGHQSSPYNSSRGGYPDEMMRGQTWDPSFSNWGSSNLMHSHSSSMSNKSPRFSNRYDFPHPQRKSANRLDTGENDTVRISSTPLKADFMNHVNIPLRSKYLRGQKLIKKWTVRNVGADDWDERITLKWTKGTENLPTKKEFKVPNCKSGQPCELSVMIVTPEKPDRYFSYFRLVRGGTMFGPRIWVDIHVVATEAELTQDDEQTKKRLDRLESRSSTQRASQRRSKNKYDGSQKRDTARRSSKGSSKKSSGSESGQSEMRVDIPLFKPKTSTSKLNRNASAFVPQSSQETPRKQGQKDDFEGPLAEAKKVCVGASDEELRTLLLKHNFDMMKAMNDWFDKKGHQV